MSLFAKLSSSSAANGKKTDSVAPVSSQAATGAFAASLQRHDALTFPCIFSTSCPFPPSQVTKGYLCRVSWRDSASGESPSAVVAVNKDTVQLMADSGRSVCSISNRLCELLGIPKDVKEVSVDEATNEDITANTLSELVVSIKDRYVSKRELWMFQIRLLGAVVYKTLTPPFDSLLKSPGLTVQSTSGAGGSRRVFGVVGPQTKMIVQSDSCQICLLLNLSQELWEFDSVTERPRYRAMLEYVLHSLTLAIEDKKHHTVLLVLTGRLDTGADVYNMLYDGGIQNLRIKELRKDLTDFFVSRPLETGEVRWDGWLRQPGSQQIAAGANIVRDTAACACIGSAADVIQPGKLSACSQTNILESINLAISHFTKHHLDRNLCATGLTISVVTANNGTILLNGGDVNLVEVSRRRILATACRLAVVSVGAKPCLPTWTPTIFAGNSRVAAPWMGMSYYTGRFAVDPVGKCNLPQAQLLQRKRTEQLNRFQSHHSGPRTRLPVSTLSNSLVPRSVVYPSSISASGISTDNQDPKCGGTLFDDELVENFTLVHPKLQRVAVEANIKPSDLKPIDNWIVQGEGVKTLHDLIGIRLTLDMQLVDNTADVVPPANVAGNMMSPPLSSSSGYPATSPSNTSEAHPVGGQNSLFGSKVHRSSLRESHIQKVILKGGDDSSHLWLLNRLDSGNVYVSRVLLMSETTPFQTPGVTMAPIKYEYALIHSESTGATVPMSTANTPVASRPVSVDTQRDVIACKHCLSISSKIAVKQQRYFFIPPPLPWNVLDEIISNPYIQQTLPSSAPHNLAPVPPELEGFHWKLRSSIRTAMFCLVPRDSGFCQSLTTSVTSSNVGVGQDVSLVGPTAGGAEITSRFLDWLRKIESVLKIAPLRISVIGEKQKRVPGLFSTLVNADGKKLNWFHLHMEQYFQYPKMFIFSIEWILCHSATIDGVIQAMRSCALEDKFSLVQIPHAQLFPLPCPPTIVVADDELPFHARIPIDLPEWTKPGFYILCLSRLLEQTRMVIVVSRSDHVKKHWTLMTKNGHILVEIAYGKISWIVNRLAHEEVTDVALLFQLVKQAIHTSLIDSANQSFS